MVYDDMSRLSIIEDTGYKTACIMLRSRFTRLLEEYIIDTE